MICNVCGLPGGTLAGWRHRACEDQVAVNEAKRLDALAASIGTTADKINARTLAPIARALGIDVADVTVDKIQTAAEAGIVLPAVDNMTAEK